MLRGPTKLCSLTFLLLTVAHWPEGWNPWIVIIPSRRTSNSGWKAVDLCVPLGWDCRLQYHSLCYRNLAVGFFFVFLKDVVIDRSNAQYISWLEKKISSFSFLGFQQHIKLLVVQKKQHKTCFKSQESYPLIKNHTLLLFLLLKDLSNYWMDYNDLIMVIDANDFSDPHTFHTLCFFWLWVTFLGATSDVSMTVLWYLIWQKLTHFLDDKKKSLLHLSTWNPTQQKWFKKIKLYCSAGNFPLAPEKTSLRCAKNSSDLTPQKLCFLWNVLTAVGWISTNFSADMHVPF